MLLILCCFITKQKHTVNASKKISLAKPASATDSYKFEEVLYISLLKNYDKTMRPPNSIQIEFAFNLIQVINLVEKEQIALLNAFIDHSWIDSRLKWKPDEFGNLTALRINVGDLWT